MVKLEVNLTDAEAFKLREVLEDAHDEGPPGEEFDSVTLMILRDRLLNELAELI